MNHNFQVWNGAAQILSKAPCRLAQPAAGMDENFQTLHAPAMYHGSSSICETPHTLPFVEGPGNRAPKGSRLPGSQIASETVRNTTL